MKMLLAICVLILGVSLAYGDSCTGTAGETCYLQPDAVCLNVMCHNEDGLSDCFGKWTYGGEEVACYAK